MYSFGPPQRGGAQAAPLRVSEARRAVFEGSSASASDPMLGVYLADMVAPFGVALHGERLGQGSGHSYGEMAGTLVSDMTASGPVDLIVFAFAVPDVVPGRSTAAHLSHLCPGNPMAFAVCDAGAAAAFTGLRLITEYTRAGGCASALLVVAEQATLHFGLAAPAPLPARHAAVALRCGWSGAARVGAVHQHTGVAPGQVAELIAGALGALAGGDEEVVLIAGNGVTAVAPPGVAVGTHVLAAPGGQPATGVWWELAGGLPGWARAGQRVLLADYDPFLEYLCTVAIEAEAAAEVPAVLLRAVVTGGAQGAARPL